jgi:SNF2 family DNA or RNA helicase
MRSIVDLRPYQVADAMFLVSSAEAVLWSDVGLGKTATTLTAIVELFDRCELTGVLIVAPLSVVKTVWMQEAEEWEHTQHLRFSAVIGSAANRANALQRNADIYLVNYENIPWLCGMVDTMRRVGAPAPFNMIVYDESTKMKNGTSKRVKATVKHLLPHMTRRVALTGTPAPNGLLDLFGQYLCIDGGRRLGKGITWYKQCYFISDYMGYAWTIRPGAGNEIYTKISDITRERKKEDYLDLPPVIINDMRVQLTGEARKKYNQLERDFFLELDEGCVEAMNAASLSGKCLQAANGACYIESGRGSIDKTWVKIHDEKLDRLLDVIEDASGSPILISYNFKHDLERIKKAIPTAVSIKDGPLDEIVEKWNRGEIPILLGHPASMGHGLNLQHGGHQLIMFGLTWNLELYLQVIGRLDRPGQENTVIVTRLLVENTIEEMVAEALTNKATTQADLRSAIQEYRRRKQ